MKIYWSPSAKGFFSPSVHEDIPEDAVRVTEAAYAALLAANAQGAEIVTNDKGKPVAQMPAAPSLEDLRAKAIARVKREAGRRINAVFPLWAQMNAMRGAVHIADDPRFAKLDAIRDASDLIEADIMATDNPDAMPIAEHPLWPEFAEKDA